MRPRLINSHFFMQTLTNQKSGTDFQLASDWMKSLLKNVTNPNRSHIWAPCCKRTFSPKSCNEYSNIFSTTTQFSYGYVVFRRIELHITSFITSFHNSLGKVLKYFVNISVIGSAFITKVISGSDVFSPKMNNVIHRIN